MANKAIYAMVLTVVGIMAVCLVVTKPLATPAFAAPTSCSLSLEANPGSVGIHGPVDRDYRYSKKYLVH
jgi:hypothetical protein